MIKIPTTSTAVFPTDDSPSLPSRTGEGFARTLSQATRSDQDLRAAADQLVSTAFIRPLLAQARQDPFKSDLFHGGRGEEIFGEQLDGILADRITSAAGFSLTEAVVRHFRPDPVTAVGGEVSTLG